MISKGHPMNSSCHAMNSSYSRSSSIHPINSSCNSSSSIFNSDTIRTLQAEGIPQKPPRSNRPLIRPRPMENLQDITNQGNDCKLWTHGDIYGMNYSQTLVASQSSFKNMDQQQNTQKIPQVPNFYEAEPFASQANFFIPSSPSDERSVVESNNYLDLLPPPPQEDSYCGEGSLDEMTMVYPPPKEYSSDDLIHNKKGVKQARCSDGMSQYLGAKRKPKYLDLDEIEVVPLNQVGTEMKRSPTSYDLSQCLINKTRKLDLGNKENTAADDSPDHPLDESFDFPDNNDGDYIYQQKIKRSQQSSDNGQPEITDIVQEGWLLKRGEHIKNWRQRYFMLRMCGDLLGFKMKPVSREEFDTPLNRFSVKGCQILATEEPRPSCLIIKLCQDMDKDKERLFCFLDANCRDAWMNKIAMVRSYLEKDANQRKICLDDFEITKVLGRGAFGKVVMCREKSTRNIYAMKMLKKTVLLEKHEVEHTRTENRVLQSLRHPFLVNLKYTFTTSERVFFVMEYVGGGELFEHLGRMGNFPEGWVRFYGGEITLGLAYLHSRGIIYRDLKLENLILDRQGHVKIVDFGLCKDKIFGGTLARTMCGTPAYMAPEVFSRLYGREVDWWSLGVVLYEMATGELPFYSQRREELFRMISKDSIRFPREIELSFQLKSIIHRLMEKNPKRRLGAGPEDGKEIMEDNFFLSLDWNLLEKRKLTPPFKPQVKHELDNPYIAPEFANQSPTLTPTQHASISSCSFSDFSFKKSSWSQSVSSREMEVAI